MDPKVTFDDLCSRYIINEPQEELVSFERMLFLIEQVRRAERDGECFMPHLTHPYTMLTHAGSLFARLTGFTRTFIGRNIICPSTRWSALWS